MSAIDRAREARSSDDAFRHVNAVRATVDTHRNRDPNMGDAMLSRLRDGLERTGRVRLITTAHAAHFCDLDARFDIIDQASYAHVFDPLRGHDPGDYGPQIFFAGSGTALRSSPRFVKLCARLGLVAHWVDTNRWPDCAATAAYDFRAEAKRLHAEQLDVRERAKT